MNSGLHLQAKVALVIMHPSANHIRLHYSFDQSRVHCRYTQVREGH